MAGKTFNTLFSQRFNCPISRYETVAFRKCLYWHAKLVAPVFRILKPDFFAVDFKFIQLLGESADLEEARLDLLNFQDANMAGGAYIRRRLKLRVSGRKAIELARELFSEAEGRGRG